MSNLAPLVPRSQWPGCVRIAYPEGVERHPSLIHRVEREVSTFRLPPPWVERIVHLSFVPSEMCLEFSTFGETIQDAREDLARVTRHVLDLLGLEPDYDALTFLYNADLDVTPLDPSERPHLRVVY